MHDCCNCSIRNKNSPSSTPVLSSTGRSINNKLSSSRSMNSSHESLLDSVGIINNLGQRSKAVGGTGSIGDNISRSVIICVVYSNNVHWSISRRSRDDDLLGSTSKMGLGLVSVGEDTCGLANVRSSNRSPRNIRGVPLSEELDNGLALSVLNDKRVGFSIGGDSSGVLSVDRIILEEVSSIVEGEEGIVHSDGGNITLVLKSSTAHETSDAAESVDS